MEEKPMLSSFFGLKAFFKSLLVWRMLVPESRFVSIALQTSFYGRTVMLCSSNI